MLCWSGWLRNAVNQKSVQQRPSSTQQKTLFRTHTNPPHTDKLGTSNYYTTVTDMQTHWEYNIQNHITHQPRHKAIQKSHQQLQCSDQWITSTRSPFQLKPGNPMHYRELHTQYKMQPWPAPSKHVQSKQNQPHKQTRRITKKIKKKSRTQLTINQLTKKIDHVTSCSPDFPGKLIDIGAPHKVILSTQPHFPWR